MIEAIHRFRAAITRVAPLVAVGFLLAAGAPTQAAPAPSGSYLRSCDNVRANLVSLKASCQTRSGSYVRARLDFYRNCRGDIANMDGRLVCRESEGDITLYEHSNFRGRSLQVSGDMPAVPRWFNDMASSIQVRRGAWQVCEDVSYRGRCETVRSDVENLNRMGLNDRISSVRRVPDRPPGGDRVPRGSYEQSCRNVTFDGRFLTADCADRRGRYSDTRLDVRTCERGDDIANRDGDLVCGDHHEGGFGNGPNGDNGDRGDRGDRGEHGDRGDNGGGDNARLPRGSYQQTCRNVRLDGDRLRGECQDRSGDWQRTSLDTGDCHGDIANDNGVLKCGGGNTAPGPMPPPAALPAGSYQQSCRNEEFVRGTLSGECKTAGGDWRKTSLDTGKCSGGADISNDNGQLKCAGANPPATTGGGQPPSSGGQPPATGGQPPSGTGGGQPSSDGSGSHGQRQPPDGSYQQSCRNASVEHGTLKAECKDKAGAWKDTSIELRGCRGSDIGNDNGALKCTPSTP